LCRGPSSFLLTLMMLSRYRLLLLDLLIPLAGGQFQGAR